jgi:hypothetical protein
MGWIFRANCPDCRHEWEGACTSYCVGRWSEQAESSIDDSFRSWFCPRCFFLLHIPRAIERNVWQKWRKTFLGAPDAQSKFLTDVVAKVDRLLANGRFYAPLPVDLEPVDCPECHQPFQERTPGSADRVVCPQCQGVKAVLADFHSHCQMPHDEHGFS